MAGSTAATIGTEELLAALDPLVDGRAWAAAPADAIAGVRSLAVARPTSEEGVAAVLRFANERGLQVAPRGGGTQLLLGYPPVGCDVVLDLTGLNRIVEYNPADMTAVVEAGLSLASAREAFAREGQWLALDPLLPPGATVGGVVATNASGPRRLRYGGVRDQIIGVRVVRADGVVAKGGGKVVKNVAGFDLPKLFTGSLGTLGVIVGAAFRLYPIAPTAATVAFTAPMLLPLAELVLTLTSSTLLPSAIDLTGALPWPESYTLAVRFEGSADAVEEQIARAELLAGATVKIHERLPAAGAEAYWRNAGLRTGADVATAATDGALYVKAALLPSCVAGWLVALERVAREWRLAGSWRAHAGHGIVVARLDGDHSSFPSMVDALRVAAGRSGGSLVVTAAPPGAGELDVWGPSAALAVMRRVKEQFDPRSTLNPGRFIGRI